MQQKVNNIKKRADEVRRKISEALAARHLEARAGAVEAFRETGVPELFRDADLVLKELTGIRRYILDGCKRGIPRLRPFTISLIKRMLTVRASFSYDAWLMDKGLSDEEILQQGDFRDEDAYLANFCVAKGNGMVIEARKEHVAQQKVLKSLADYVKAAACYAKELKAVKATELWIKAFGILVSYDSKAPVPYTVAKMEEVFSYVALAADETYVAWMYPQLPTLAELRKEAAE